MQSKREEYLAKLTKKRLSPYIKVITGIRRCGKSYLLKTLYRDYLRSAGVDNRQIVSVELDDDRFEELRDKNALRSYIENKCSDDSLQYYVFIDEVQMAAGFEGAIISLNNHPNYDMYITGSNSEFLSRDISSKFRDRGDEIRIHPLSYREFYDVYQGDKRFALTDYLTFGGMPRLINESDAVEKMAYLVNLVENTYLADVVERNHVRLPEEMGALFDVLCSTTGSLVNPSSLAGTLLSEKHVKIDGKTVFSYMEHFERAYLLETVKRFNIKGKSYLKSSFKCYPEDVGLRNARLNFRQLDQGFGIETVVYNELRRRGYRVDVGMIETRERNKKGKQVYKQNEVDFVARLASKEYYIQVMDKSPLGQHGANEYGNLLKVPGSFKKIAVVNEPFRAYTNSDGILVASLEELLLERDSLDW